MLCSADAIKLPHPSNRGKITMETIKISRRDLKNNSHRKLRIAEPQAFTSKRIQLLPIIRGTSVVLKLVK